MEKLFMVIKISIMQLIDNNRQKMSYKERKKEQKRLKLEWPCSCKQINCNCIYVPHKRDIGPGLGYQCMPSSASGYILSPGVG